MKGTRKLTTDNARRAWSTVLCWTQRNVPVGLRTVFGIFLILCGILGFLPVLGFWMIPLGVAVVFLDVKVIRKRLLQRSARSQSVTHDGHEADTEDEK